jgi:hypothetical protein
VTLTGYLLDTNVLSETRKPQPNGGVLAFIEKSEESGLFVSVLTLGELRKGVEAKRRTDPLQASLLSAWVDGIETTFADRFLPVDRRVASIWGEVAAGRSLPLIDALLAATAFAHGLTLVTRNVKDVQSARVPVINPWSE